jgi:protoheme IX farnesyltransferase
VTIRSLAIELSPARTRDLLSVCLELSKPRMVTMILVSTMAGFYVGSSSSIAYGLLLHALIGTALSAAGALALNQVMERETDALMRRTMARPLPAGRILPMEALLFGAGSTSAGLCYLALMVNPLSAAVTASVVALYLFAYTPMKQRSALCTVVGAFPGALPPVAGWAAATGDLGVGALILFGIMFFWQLPHSLSIAWLYREEYAKAGIRLLPTIEPSGHGTARHIFVNALALLAVGLLPTLVGMAGWAYFVTAAAMGLWMLAGAASVALRRTEAAARTLLRVSLVYVPVVLLAMVLDRIPPG